MEERANPITKSRSVPRTAAAPQRKAPLDLREYIEAVDKLGELRRVSAEVDRDQEMNAIVYLANLQNNAPAFIFDHIKGAAPGFKVLWNMFGSSVNRLAAAVGEPPGLSPLEMVERFKRLFNDQIPPVFVDKKRAPVNANTWRGADIDITRFPSSIHFPLDGGHYIGTVDATLTRDPDNGWINVGTYRQMIQGKDRVALYISPGKDGRLHIERYWSRGEAAEVALCWGIDPVLFLVSSNTFPKTVSELGFAGGMRGAPVEMTTGDVISVPYPARAEIVIEGIIPPGSEKPEGPFGEFTGYYARPGGDAFLVEIKAVHHRDQAIQTDTVVAEFPAGEELKSSVMRAARVWNDLDRIGIPGIRAVFCPMGAANGFGMTVVSIEQRYAGHAAQVLALAAQCPGGAYFSKWIVVVDDDIDPSNVDQVLWAMATRCRPEHDIDILRQTWSTYLDPSQNPPEIRPYSSKALINACMEHRFIKQFSKRTKLKRSTYEAVARRWTELGFKGSAPKPWALED